MNSINAQVTDTKRSRNVQPALPAFQAKKSLPVKEAFLIRKTDCHQK